MHNVTLLYALFPASLPSFKLPAVPAFLLLTTLLLGCAASIALCWARAIPSDDPDDSLRPSSRAISLFVLVSLSFAARLPGVPRAQLEHRFLEYFPPNWWPWLVLSAQVILVLIPGLAALYAIFRTKPIDRPLLWSGLLVVLLWLLSSFLTRSWLGASLF